MAAPDRARARPPRGSTAPARRRRARPARRAGSCAAAAAVPLPAPRRRRRARRGGRSAPASWRPRRDCTAGARASGTFPASAASCRATSSERRRGGESASSRSSSGESRYSAPRRRAPARPPSARPGGRDAHARPQRQCPTARGSSCRFPARPRARAHRSSHLDRREMPEPRPLLRSFQRPVLALSPSP